MRAGLFVLALANLSPLAGLFLLGWRGESVLLLYAFEAVVVFFVTARMLAVVDEARGEYLAMPFMAYYIWGLLLCGAIWAGYFSMSMPGLRDALTDPGVWCAAAGLLVSHLFTYLADFIGRREYEQMPPERITAQMKAMYFYALGVPFFFTELLFLPPKLLAAVLVVAKTAQSLHAYGKDRAAGAATGKWGQGPIS